MADIAKLIAVCAGVLIAGALFMMIPEYKLNTLIFAGILAVFVAVMVGAMVLLSKAAKNIVIGTICMGY